MVLLENSGHRDCLVTFNSNDLTQHPAPRDTQVVVAELDVTDRCGEAGSLPCLRVEDQKHLMTS